MACCLCFFSTRQHLPGERKKALSAKAIQEKSKVTENSSMASTSQVFRTEQRKMRIYHSVLRIVRLIGRLMFFRVLVLCTYSV
jgi:hypothetical protein